LSLTIDFDPVRNALFDWLNRAVNGPSVQPGVSGPISVQRTEQGSPRSSSVFVEYKFVTALESINRQDELRFNEDTEKFFLYGRREFTVQVDTIGEKSLECITQIDQSTSVPQICEQLSAAGLGIIRKEPILNANEFLETEHEERHIMDVRFSMALQNFEIVDGLGTIGAVGLENRVFSEPLNVEIKP